MTEHLPEQIVELEIDGLTSEGAGVGRWQGMAVFVEGALPGEIVKARLRQEKKKYAQAELVEILYPSQSRCEPECPHDEDCGGCVLQHLAYRDQLIWKRQWLVDSLRRIGGLELTVLPTLPSAELYSYRNRVQLHVLRQAGQLKLGFYGRGGRVGTLCDSCRLMRPLLTELALLLSIELPKASKELAGLQHIALRCNSGGDQAALVLVGLPDSEHLRLLTKRLLEAEPRLVSVWANWGRPVYGIYGEHWQKLAGEDKLTEHLGAIKLMLSPAAFTQVNSMQARLLYERVAACAGLSGQETLLDIYSGVGMIALYLAGQAKEVIGVEEYAPAVADAVYNAQLNGLTNCRFEAGRAETVLPRLAEEGLVADVAILDPPRAGCAAMALTALAALKPRRVVYVSCDPATLARDLRLLTELGYNAGEVQPLDMFPHTGHVEAYCSLERV